MKTLIIIILMLFTSTIYSQEIGKPIPNTLKKSMTLEKKQYTAKYTSKNVDSTCIIRCNPKNDIIFDIDYILSEKAVKLSNMAWVTKHQAIGENIFYEKGTYYFITCYAHSFLIQVRNADSFK